eukprot:TRINITY_DN3075_c0_g1_i1.p3 TRINITY_DN3075_c0_g1~~TRINITY_DN3075_c0_g1_i1.p3  ORF type:complete len:279 (-),score=44.60 TRINITY_DN3075_c0_g1_i1:17-853(-)
MQIVSCKKLMNFIDSFLQSRPEQIEEGSTLWKLQNQLLCQSSLDLKILTLVVQNFFFQANQLAQVHPGAYRNIKEDDIKISILTKKWVEMAQYFSFDIEKDSTTDAGDYGLNGIQLIEGILQLVLLLTCSKGKKILIRKTANPFSSTEISNEYKLLQAAESIGTALTTSIEKMAEIVINTFNYREAGTILQKNNFTTKRYNKSTHFMPFGFYQQRGAHIHTQQRKLFYKPLHFNSCLLYTSDAADDTPCVDLGGRRIIKKKKRNTIHKSTENYIIKQN